MQRKTYAHRHTHASKARQHKAQKKPHSTQYPNKQHRRHHNPPNLTDLRLSIGDPFVTWYAASLSGLNCDLNGSLEGCEGRFEVS
ncbi:hypothetical protein JB92DRAFT_3039828 [Gautieria morchelliformis]|nr:hypothetical protein JB92DRAFT_3039828 [Gautieria morchelliformis]